MCIHIGIIAYSHKQWPVCSNNEKCVLLKSEILTRRCVLQCQPSRGLQWRYCSGTTSLHGVTVVLQSVKKNYFTEILAELDPYSQV